MTEPVNDSIQNELSNQDSINQSNSNNATGSNRNANSFRSKQNRQQHNNNNNRPNNRSNYNNNFNNYNNNNQRYSNNSYNQYYNQQNDFFPIDQNNQNNNFNYSNQSNNSAKSSNSRQEMNSNNNNQQASSNHRSNNRNKKKNTSRSNYNQNDERNNSQQELNNEQKIFNRTNSNQQEASNKKSRPHSNQQQQQQQKKPKEPQPIETRSEILIDQLMKFNLECMVCCHKIRDDKSIWSCNVCYHIFHLYCIKKWANSPAAKVVEDDLNKWRCPGCQTTHQQIPSKYTCFCGKKINPDLNKQDENKPFHLRQVPHSCGQICGKSLANTNNLMCKHTCVALCHPGPCQPCEALVNRMCNCSNAKFQVKCSSNKQPICEKKCEKLLNCLKHNCGQICHANECQSCQIEIEQECYSHQTKHTAKCGSASKYSCSQKCNKLLKCGKHYCDQECHDGDCPTCPLLPSKLLNCPCGKTAVKELLIKNKIIRTSCTDPIPVCTKTCNKLLHSCGDAESDLHFCEAKCHLNECPPCLKQIEIKCRCGKESESVQCFQKPHVKLCNRRCFKKKFCGRHQCNEICCNDKDHLCTIVCNRQLDCGLHKCELLCHKGPCQRCLIASFEERICDCGQTVQYPPIRCGTKPIECNKPCAREHDCLHPINHNCHWEPNCPPCSYLTSKMCMGQHELRHNIPCFMKDISCGRLCGKQLPNCSHKCNKICHKGDCLDENETCTQACNKQRLHCEHECSEPCHSDQECPDTICQAIVQIKCKCGIKTKQIKCLQRMYEPTSQIVFENLASELKEMLSCRSIDISTFKNTETLKKKRELPCDEECLIAERNKNLADALKIDSTGKPKVIYSDFLKNYAREEPVFIGEIENKLESFVKEMKLNVKVNKKYFNMPAMKSYERRVIHELAPYYGFETMSEDPEPFRNVCLIATKDKCILPTNTLMQSVEGIKPKSTMSRLSNLKQLNQVASNPVQSNLKVLQQHTTEPYYLPVSSGFSGLNDENEEDEINEASNKLVEKKIDYFDITE